MYDNDFVRSGWHPPQYLQPEDLKIVQEDNQVTWKLEGRSYICRPPVWEVKGSHAGVEIDLTCQQSGSGGPLKWNRIMLVTRRSSRRRAPSRWQARLFLQRMAWVSTNVPYWASPGTSFLN